MITVTAEILDSVIAYFAALGLFVVLWTMYGWIIGLFKRNEANGRWWFIGKRNRNS